MATRVSYLNALNTYWQDIDIKNVERDFFTNGVADFSKTALSPENVGDDLHVVPQSTPNKTVKVKAGVCYFKVIRSTDEDGDGANDEFVLRFHNLEDATVVIPDNASGSPRNYEICCSIPDSSMNAANINDTASNIGSIIVQLQGTGLQNKYLLATITVENGFTQVTSGKITDNRKRVQLKAIPEGLTASIAEINLAMDGILASAENINILENTTVTKAEFNNALTGIESSAEELNLLHDVAGLAKQDLEKLADIDAGANEIDQALDGVSPDVTAANLNILTGGGFTNLHKHAADPLLSGITESPEFFYLPSGDIEAVAEKGIMTRFTYEEGATELSTLNIGVVNDDFQNYESNYKVITNFEGDAGETYTGGSVDTVEYKQGTQARKLSLTTDSTATLLVDFTSEKDLSVFISNDKVEFWIYLTMQTNADLANIQLGSASPSLNYFANNFFSQIIQNGWNHISIPISNFTVNGSPNWNNIVRARIELSTSTSGGCDFTIDSLRVVKSANATNGFWSNDAGFWEIHQVGTVKRFVKTDETAVDCESVLSLGNQSRNYLNGIFTVRIRRLQGTSNSGIKWRYTSPSSCYHAYFTGTEIKLAKNNGTVLQSAAYLLNSNTDYWLRVTFNDNSVTISVSTDGISFTDQIKTTDSSILTAGQIALFDNGNITAFDQVVFQQTSTTFERSENGTIVKIEENTGDGDKFDGYSSFFNRIATFETDENTMTGGAADTVNFKTGTQGWKISASNQYAYDNTLNLNLNKFEDGINSANTDMIAFWAFVAVEVPNTLNLRLSEVQDVKEAQTQVNAAGLALGWNYLMVAKSAFTIVGGFDWTNVQQLRFWYTHTNNNPQITFDSIQLVKSTGIVSSKYDIANGNWLIEKDIDNNNQYLVQTNESSGEKILLLKTDGTKNIFQDFTLRGKFNARRGNASGLIFKYLDTNNFIRLQSKNGKISVVKRVAGVESFIGEEMAFIPTQTDFYHIKVECNANIFKYFFSEDGAIWVLIGVVSITDFVHGQIGIFSEGVLLRTDELFIYAHNQGGDTFYELFYDDDGNVSSIIKKPIISS